MFKNLKCTSEEFFRVELSSIIVLPAFLIKSELTASHRSVAANLSHAVFPNWFSFTIYNTCYCGVRAYLIVHL